MRASLEMLRTAKVDRRLADRRGTVFDVHASEVGKPTLPACVERSAGVQAKHREAIAAAGVRETAPRLSASLNFVASIAARSGAPQSDPALKRRDVASFVQEERAATTDARLFAFSSYRVLAKFEAAAGGRIPTPVLERMIAAFALVGRRGGAVKPASFRSVWEDVKKQKEEEAVRREARRSDKAGWRSAIADSAVGPIRPAAELHPGAAATTRSRGPPVKEGNDFDLEAEISALFADHRARLPQMPTPKNGNSS